MSDTNKTKNSQSNFIQISPSRISYGFQIHSIKEANGMYSWYIPSFDTYFSSNDKELGEQRAIEISKSFFNYWLKKKGYRAFLMQILKLGYQADSHEELTALLRRTNLNGKLSTRNKVLPDAFRKTKGTMQEGIFATAV